MSYPIGNGHLCEVVVDIVLLHSPLLRFKNQ